MCVGYICRRLEVKMRVRSNMLRYGRWMERKATMQVCGGRDEDTGLGLSFDMQGGLFLWRAAMCV